MSKIFEVKKSKIAGNGVFVKIEVKKGKTIMFLTGEEMTLDEGIKRVNEGKEEASDPLLIGNEIYLDLDEVPRTVNHSCDPNCFIRGKNELVALRDIRKGEEITYDYSTTMDDNEEKIKASGREVWTGKCNCGAKNCRGLIDQFKRMPHDRQNFYIKNKFMPDFMLRIFK